MSRGAVFDFRDVSAKALVGCQANGCLTLSGTVNSPINQAIEVPVWNIVAARFTADRVEPTFTMLLTLQTGRHCMDSVTARLAVIKTDHLVLLRFDPMSAKDGLSG